MLFLIVTTVTSSVFMCIMFFSLLTVAERTLNQRFVHAKYFCYLTSMRRARKHNLPHFRLSRVENIKMWLSVRSFMKRRGPQRSIDAIISCTFLISVTLAAVVCIRVSSSSRSRLDVMPRLLRVNICLSVFCFFSSLLCI